MASDCLCLPLMERRLEQEERIAENDRQMHQMQRRLREEELRILRGQAKVDERALDEALMTGDGAERAKAIKRPGAATTRRDGRGGSGGGDDFGNGGGMIATDCY